MALFRTGLYVKDHSVEKVQVASTPIANYNGNVTGLIIPEIVAMINAIQASGTPAPDNVIPIYGRNGVLVNRCGKNLFDKSIYNESGWSLQENGYYNGRAQALMQRSRYSYVNGGLKTIGIVTVSFDLLRAGGAMQIYCLYEGDSSWTNLSGNITSSGHKTFTTNNAKNCIAVGLYTTAGSSSTDFSLKNFQIEISATETAYEDYNGNPYTQYFAGLLNGTYGFVNLGDLTWTYVNNVFAALNLTGVVDYKQITNTPMICDKYNYLGTNTTGTSWFADKPDKTFGSFFVYGNVNRAIYVKDSAYTDETAFKNAMNGVYLIYENETATTPTITQSQIDTLATAFGVDDKSVIIVFGQTVYVGYIDVNNGLLVITHANIASYNGESINEPWLSSMDEYSSGATPTTGAQVVYPLTTPITVQLSPKQLEQLLVNNVFADSGNVAVKFYNVIR